MMRKIIVSVFGIFVCVSAMAEYCVDETYTIRYSCGEGTLNEAAGATLPADFTAAYGQSVTPTALTRTQTVGETAVVRCLPPADMEWGGQAILGPDGEIKSQYASNNPMTFTYLYMTDVTIVPRWVPIMTEHQIKLQPQVGPLWTTSAWTRDYGTWKAVFPYGWMTGESVCSSYWDGEYYEQNVPYYIPFGQEKIQPDEADGTSYCYCRLTDPYSAKSPWVFRMSYGGAYACDIRCANNCAEAISWWAIYRQALWDGFLEY